jgi:hypothetical protein
MAASHIISLPLSKTFFGLLVKFFDSLLYQIQFEFSERFYSLLPLGYGHGFVFTRVVSLFLYPDCYIGAYLTAQSASSTFVFVDYLGVVAPGFVEQFRHSDIAQGALGHAKAAPLTPLAIDSYICHKCSEIGLSLVYQKAMINNQPATVNSKYFLMQVCWRSIYCNYCCIEGLCLSEVLEA